MDGSFSNLSAYESLLDPGLRIGGSIFRDIWRWKGPQRGRIHLWKMAMSAFLTNDARRRRGLTDSALCPVCGLEDETMIHLFRDCGRIKDTWLLIFQGLIDANFFLQDGMTWLENNLKDQTLVDGIAWNVWFGLVTMTAWQVRNEKVFQDVDSQSFQTYHRIHSLAAWVRRCIDDSGRRPVCVQSVQSDIAWRALRNGWVKLNTDAAVTNLGAKAAAGGILRDDNGNFLLGFSMDVGEATVTVAELKAILSGVKLVWRRGYSFVAIESDSLTAVTMIQRGVPTLHPSFVLVKEIQETMRKFNECSISHSLREANQVADSLAIGLSLTMCSKLFEALPFFLSIPFNADRFGRVFPRGF